MTSLPRQRTPARDLTFRQHSPGMRAAPAWWLALAIALALAVVLAAMPAAAQLAPPVTTPGTTSTVPVEIPSPTPTPCASPLHTSQGSSQRGPCQPAPSTTAPPATSPPPDEPDCTVKPLLPGACEWPPDDAPTTIPSPDQPAPWDINGRIINAVDQWLIDIINSAFEWVFALLAGSLVTTPSVQENERVHQFWGWSLGLANTLLVLLWILGAAVAMGYQTVQTRYSVKEIAPKAVLAVLAANLSLFISGQAIRFANALSRALLGAGFQTGAFTGRLRQVTVSAVTEHGEVVLLMGLVLVVLTVTLLLYAVLRNAVVVLLVVAGPLALACHSLPTLDRAAALWWRALAGCLGVQVAQALTLAAAVRVFFQDGGVALLGLESPNLLADLVVASALLLLLVLAPLWGLRLVLRGRRSVAVRVAGSYALARHARLNFRKEL